MLFTALCLVMAGNPRGYEVGRARLSDSRRELTSKRPTALAATHRTSRAMVLRFYDEDVFPSWAGTPWDFNGTTTTPGEGHIACGYYVSTTLEHAGFHVQRVKLAQQASLDIVRSLTDPVEPRVLRRVDRAEVVAEARALAGDDGLLVVGLDNHVGFLRVTPKHVRFCHASYVGDKVVVCEDPLTAPAFASSVYVLGDPLNDRRLDDWRLGRDIATLTRR